MNWARRLKIPSSDVGQRCAGVACWPSRRRGSSTAARARPWPRGPVPHGGVPERLALCRGEMTHALDASSRPLAHQFRQCEAWRASVQPWPMASSATAAASAGFRGASALDDEP
ncbi:hypothetical protein ACTMU2_37110 [Cupriavidus basilensis]